MVAIIAVLSAVTLPTFSRVYRSELLRNEGRVLMATVQQARYQAVVRQYPMTLKLDFANQAYWVEMSQETVTNLTAQMFEVATNSFSGTTGTTNYSSTVDTTDLSTNAVVTALPTITRRQLEAPMKLAQFQTIDGDIEADENAEITCYPNGSSKGGFILLTGANNESLGVEVDPLTSLPKLILDAQPK